MPVGYKQEITTGPAGVLCSIDGKVEEYTAEITRIDMNHEDTNKSFVIHITDQRLLEGHRRDRARVCLEPLWYRTENS